MTQEEFEQLISEALDSLPEEFAKQLDNVEVIAQLWPTLEDLHAGHVGAGMTLFGLYQGVAKTNRGNYVAAPPDIIKIFAGPMLSLWGDDKETIRYQVRKTVLHELGHHFGMSEEDIRHAQG